MNPVHVKLEYNEALNAKKTLLYSEMDFLNLLKNLRRYSIIKKEQEKVKQMLNRELRKIELEVGFILKAMPEPESKYERMAKRPMKEKTIKKINILEIEKRSQVEEELADISNRLKRLSA